MINTYTFQSSSQNYQFDLSQLNDFAVNELHDYYRFLLSKQKKVNPNQQKGFISQMIENPIEVNEFTPFSRETIFRC